MRPLDTEVLELEDQTLQPARGPQHGRGLRTNFLWILAANLVYAACQWLILVVLAKKTSPEDVGAFALGLAVTAPVIMLANLQLRSVQATDAQNRFRFEDYVTLRYVTTAFSFALIVLLAATRGSRSQASLVILVVGVSKCFEALSDVLQGYFQHREQMSVVGISLMLKGGASLLFVLSAVSIWRNAVSAAAGLCMASALTYFVYDRRVTARLRSRMRKQAPESIPVHPRPHARKIWALAWLALPLGVVQGLVSLSMNIPRYYLEHFSGPRELGVYSALASFIVVGQTVVSALGNAASPPLARAFAGGRLTEFYALLGKMMLAGTLLGVAGILVAAAMGRPLLEFIFRPEYASYLNVLIVLMVAGATANLAWFAGFGLTAAQSFRTQIPLLAAVCLAGWIASRFLIPAYGSLGAGWALVTTMAVQLVGAAAILIFVGRVPSRVGHA